MMKLKEARKIASDEATEHAPVIFDLAGNILERHGEQIAAQLAWMKAEHARLNHGNISNAMRKLIHAH